MSNKCPVCKSDVSAPPEPFHYSGPGVQGQFYRCQRCGDYHVEQRALAYFTSLLDDERKIAVLSHWIRTKFESIRRDPSRTESIILTAGLIENIIKQSPPSCAEQADKFILWLGNSENPPGEQVRVEPETHQSIMGAMTPKGFSLVVDNLVHEDLLKNVTSPVGNVWTITLSCKGWEQYDKLKRGAVDSRRAFMAMPYGKSELDEIVELVLKPGVKQAGFDLSRLVDTPQPAGLIDDRLRVEIQTSRFLVADLTHGNAGAYWEAGYAEGLGRPVIYTCEKKVFEDVESRPHFDTNHHLTILWDMDNPQEAGEKLKTTIRATLPAEAKLIDD